MNDEIGVNVMSQAVKASELCELFNDIGLPVEPAGLERKEAVDVLTNLSRAIKLLLVSGHLDREKLAEALELAEELE